MTGNAKESRARAHPAVQRHVVVGIAVVVDIARVDGRNAGDGTEPPIDARNKTQRMNILPRTNQLHTLSSALY